MRIDAYPHLVWADPQKEWHLVPVWDQQNWGAPVHLWTTVLPQLTQFMERCKAHGVQVALSSWFREDEGNTRMQRASAELHAEAWLATLRHIEEAGLLDTVLYVDLCNEWPMEIWAPYFRTNERRIAHEASVQWMAESIGLVRAAYPQLPFCYSFSSAAAKAEGADLSSFDLLEPHIWMATMSDFYHRIPYEYERFDPAANERLARKAEPLYRASPEHWESKLREHIGQWAALGKARGLPLVTTECWGVVNWNDRAHFGWDWVLDLCEKGTQWAIETGQWASIATSNFCAPQFVGMWREVEWHRRQTKAIRAGQLPPLGQPRAPRS